MYDAFLGILDFVERALLVPWLLLLDKVLNFFRGFIGGFLCLVFIKVE
jgi:hypothetical protein